MNKPLFVIYDGIFQDWQLGSGMGTHPTNPKRAELACEIIAENMGDRVVIVKPCPRGTTQSDRAKLEATHDHAYVKRTLGGVNYEWSGKNTKVAKAGFAMFRGTIRAVELILSGKANVVFNPQGAKHHAKFASGSGFCVFNDMAYAALEFQKAGLRPLYIDWDIHAGDGVYHMLKGTQIPTISIHNGGNFPGDRLMQSLDGTRRTIIDEKNLSYNFNVLSGDGDDQLINAIWEAEKIIKDYKPDVILLAAGADGHAGPNLLGASNTYSTLGFAFVADMVGNLAKEFCQGRVLIGGAGGYQPLKETPEIWSLVVRKIYYQVVSS